MNLLKYIFCTLLIALSLTSAKAGDEALANHYRPCRKIRIDGSSVSKEFYVCTISTIEVRNWLVKTGRISEDAKTDDISKEQAFIFDYVKDYIDFFHIKWNPCDKYHTLTGFSSISDEDNYYDDRFAVYVPETNKIYISQSLELKREVIEFVKLTGDEHNLFEIKVLPLNIILTIALGLLFVPLMVFASNKSLKFLEFNADKMTMISVAIISTILWSFFCKLFVYFELIWAIIFSPVITLPLFMTIFFTHIHLKIDGKRRIMKLFTYCALLMFWMFLGTLIFYIYHHGYWPKP